MVVRCPYCSCRMTELLRRELSRFLVMDATAQYNGRRGRGFIISYGEARGILLVIALFVVPVLGQLGFLSIDCGSPSSYYDNSTGINWVTDSEYISSGKTEQNVTIPPQSDFVTVNPTQLSSSRYFDDDRNKDCYKLPVRSHLTYLVRINLNSGKLVNVSNTVIFSVYINTTEWFIVEYNQATQTGGYFYTFEEILVYSRGTVLNICIVRGVGVPFISSVELRPIKNTTMYSFVRADNVMLPVLYRLNMGPSYSDPDYIRYPDDIYDRIWTKATDLLSENNATHISGTNLSSSMIDAPDYPPSKVMRDASVFPRDNVTYTFYLTTDNNLTNMFIAAYFQDVDGNATASSHVRGIDFFINEKLVTSFNTSRRALEITNAAHPAMTTDPLRISFVRSNWSRMTPLINALEIYYVAEINSSATSSKDENTLAMIQSALNFTGWNGDPCNPVPHNWLGCDGKTISSVTSLSLPSDRFTGEIPEAIANLSSLTTISLNNNFFNGTIPNSFKDLLALQSLRLQFNNLSGDIPSFLASLPNLTELNLDNNNFSGLVPLELTNRTGLAFTALNNPHLICNVSNCGYKPVVVNGSTPFTKSSSNATNVGVIVGATLGSVTAVLILVFCCWRFRTRKRRAQSQIIKSMGNAEFNGSSADLTIGKQALGASIMSLTLQEVNDVTKKFSKKIGEGSFGPVYYGRLPDDTEVAVKARSGESRQGMKEFLNEVALLSRIHHRNLVSLVGYCEEAGQQILIYTYVANGTLREHLYGAKEKQHLDWITRLDIALNSARGLEYLHTDCKPRIIHRDVKTSNILLDENLVAKVADFGISKQTPEGVFSGVDTLLRGTPGYFDPEYFITQRLTQKSDVYSFGVVLLEMVTGRHPHISELPDGTTVTLIQRVQGAVREGKFKDIVDPSLGGRFDEESMLKVIDLALKSTDLETKSRPDMGQVVRELQAAYQLEEMLTLSNRQCLETGVLPDEPQHENHHVNHSFDSIALQGENELEAGTRSYPTTSPTTQSEARNDESEAGTRSYPQTQDDPMTDEFDPRSDSLQVPISPTSEITESSIEPR